MNYRTNKDGHAEVQVNQTWLRPTQKLLELMTKEQRLAYGRLVESTLQGTEDRVKLGV
jgi:hypothetical protein